ncbi:MAG: 16S rRNA (guanine(527)-N(7))-methyltransferase RsmG [Clostridia bacterium]|nr:16S rRNA (guanine(527)-N(7))-methyltransferase RsmG [Clostridia bacterium]
MEKIFENFGFDLTEKQTILFEKYYEILSEYNSRFNLTSITEKNEVYLKHFVDSLFGGKFIEGSFIDVGSGGGFPAIPLKILKPELKATLLDATGKKCEFLKTVAKELELKDITVICGRAEELAHDKFYREKFDCATARAVAALPVLTEYCLPFVKKGGKFVAYKGDAAEEIKNSENALKILGGEIERAEKLDLSGNLRTIIVVKKVKETGAEFPRTNARIKKKPL